LILLKLVNGLRLNYLFVLIIIRTEILISTLPWPGLV